MPGQIDEAFKNDRLCACNRWVERSVTPTMPAPSAKTLDVLFEKPGRHAGQIGGKSALSAGRLHVEGPSR